MASLHYTRDTPSESFLVELRTLNKFSNEQFGGLSVILISFLSEPSKSTWIMDQLDRFAEQHGVNSASLKNVIKTFLIVLTGCIKMNLDPALIKEDLITLGLDEEKTTSLTDLWKDNRAAMTKGTLSQTLSVNQLVDMEWKFGVTAASSELNKVGSTFLQLKLVIDKGHATENVYMELTLPQFYSFLHEIEKAKSSLEFLS